MKCQTEVIEERSDGLFLHKCKVCGKAVAFKSPDPRRAHMECGIDNGPGTELHELLRALGVKKESGCGCEALARDMNRWRAAGCRERLEEIVAAITAKQSKYGLTTKALAALLAVGSGLALRINPLAPIRSLVLLAIERADAREKRNATARS